jgi:hypothetical protein
MYAYLYLIISVLLIIAAIRMISHKNRSLIRALGLILAYFASGIAMKGYFLIAILN